LSLRITRTTSFIPSGRLLEALMVGRNPPSTCVVNSTSIAHTGRQTIPNDILAIQISDWPLRFITPHTTVSILTAIDMLMPAMAFAVNSTRARAKLVQRDEPLSYQNLFRPAGVLTIPASALFWIERSDVGCPGASALNGLARSWLWIVRTHIRRKRWQALPRGFL